MGRAGHATDKVVIISDKRNFDRYIQAYNISPTLVASVG